MAIVQNPIIGAARKTAGGFIFSYYNGKHIIRQKPTVVANPQTQAQMENREEFKIYINALEYEVQQFLKYSFPLRPRDKSIFAAFQIQLAKIHTRVSQHGQNTPLINVIGTVNDPSSYTPAYFINPMFPSGFSTEIHPLGLPAPNPFPVGWLFSACIFNVTRNYCFLLADQPIVIQGSSFNWAADYEPLDKIVILISYSFTFPAQKSGLPPLNRAYMPYKSIFKNRL